MENFMFHRLESVETDKFRLSFFNSLTNLKIILICSPRAQGEKALLIRVYQLYGEYVKNNTFYNQGQPLKAKKFDSSVQELFNKK